MAAPELKAGLATEAASDCEGNLIKETAFLEHWVWEGSEGLWTAAGSLQAAAVSATGLETVSWNLLGRATVLITSCRQPLLPH